MEIINAFKIKFKVNLIGKNKAYSLFKCLLYYLRGIAYVEAFKL
jgi:hypothetical protein